MSPTNDVPKSDVRSAHHGFHLAERVKEGGHKRRDMKVTAKRWEEKWRNGGREMEKWRNGEMGNGEMRNGVKSKHLTFP